MRGKPRADAARGEAGRSERALRAAGPRRRVGRPPRSPERTSEIRAAVVTAARRLFDTESYDAVSMRRIAKECGCAAPTLYSLFRSKRDLLRNVWDDVFARLVESCAADLSPDRPALERVRSLGRRYVEHWLAHPDDFRVIFLIEDRPSPPAGRYYVETSQVLSHFDGITAVFRDAVACGELPRRTDADLAAQAYFCVLQGLAGSLITVPEFPWADRDALIDAAIDCFLRGLGRAPTRAPGSDRKR
jgi:AcrR family transcriptional regulator